LLTARLRLAAQTARSNDRRKFRRQNDDDRSGHRLTAKGRIRFMTSKKPVPLDKAYPEFISQLAGFSRASAAELRAFGQRLHDGNRP
jgi:hypothetical protein